MSDKALIPLGALMLLASVGSWAQSAPVAGVQLPTVTVKESAEIQNKDTLKPATTTIGKGKQALRDIPQSITVVTEKLIDDRIELLPCASATETPSRPQP